MYGSGYVLWPNALCRPTDDRDIFALDLSLTDWLAGEKRPVYLLRNPHDEPRTVSFCLADVWLKVAPALARGFRVLGLRAMACAQPQGDSISVTLAPHDIALVAVLGADEKVSPNGSMLCCGDAELILAHS